MVPLSCLCSVVAIMLVAIAPAAAAPDGPLVSSIAGTGRAALVDGDASAAAFLMPAAVAVASDGTVYVADSAAHNIRRIRHGRVDTLAGISDLGAAVDARAGGYLDGRAGIARFSRPVGVVVAKDGSIFVADAGNDRIRKIADGIVSTLAGSSTHGSNDGPGGEATFENIRALAIDGDDNLYVADEGVGIRKIAPDGVVTTLKLGNAKHPIATVAARGSGEHLQIAYADDAAVHMVVNGTDEAVAYAGDREPDDSGLAIGLVDAIAIVNENTVIVCDVATNAVRVVRLPAPPYVSDTMTRALAGGIREGGDVAGGFLDGPSAFALVSTPLGVALAPDGSVIVADAGNRRIRKIAHVDFRESVLPDLSNLVFAKGRYNIAVVGASYAFFNVLWPESIGGQLESGLGRDYRAIGLTRRPAVTTFRVDAIGARAETSLIRNDLGDGQVDLIVLLADSYEPPDRKLLQALQAELLAAHTQLLVVFTPQGFEASPLEYWKANAADPAYDYATLRARAARMESYVQSIGAHALFLLDAMQRAELEPGRQNFYYGADHHLSVYGNEWVGRQVVTELERWKPWR